MKEYRIFLILPILILVLFKQCNRSQDRLSNFQEAQKQRNIILILTDDHRYDFMGFTGKVPWLETPYMDQLAREGIYFPNAYVATSLCSPSRMSILTGMYSHSHKVVDNYSPLPGELTFFPEILQDNGYQTAFFGKWHIGEDSDHPQPGFNQWVSFKGQGVYFNPGLNINGRHVEYSDSSYLTDILTDLAIEWLQNRNTEKPFFLYLSHKAVHEDFYPAPRHRLKYENEEVQYPSSYNSSLTKIRGKNLSGKKPYPSHEYYGSGRMPDWQKQQRESVHGVDFILEGTRTFEDIYKRYCETLLGVDDGIGRILKFLNDNELSESTLLIYMGDNGFSFGEHGLIDKRQFYEESAKIPLLIRCPELFRGSNPDSSLVQNIDIAPTILDAAGLEIPGFMQGKSILPLLTDDNVNWRNRIYYEYYWEYDYPYTPTMHGVRTDKYKLIRYHGIWDTNEFYDLKADPHETNNLIASPSHQEIIEQLSDEIFDWLEETGGMQIPLKRTVRPKLDHRNGGLY